MIKQCHRRICVFTFQAGKLLAETEVDRSMTSPVYVSTPGAHEGAALRRARSIQLIDEQSHYEEIPADFHPQTPVPTARRTASCDNLAVRPQPPLPSMRQRLGQRSQVNADSIMRKPSYDDNDVILIDSAIYGWRKAVSTSTSKMFRHTVTIPVRFSVLYYCNTVQWSWDWSLVSTTNWLPSELWRCWLGHLTCKNRPWNDL